MQVEQLPNGTFMVSNIRGNFKGTISAWYDRYGHCLICKQILVFPYRTRKIKSDGPMDKLIQSIGQQLMDNKHLYCKD